jgi:GNAT superfamily N-acetyltransferase
LKGYIAAEIEGDLANIPQSYQGGIYLIAVYRGAVIGMVGGCANHKYSSSSTSHDTNDGGGGVMELKRLSVDLRLHSRGLGTLLVQTLHRKARQLGFVRMRLATSTAQQPAIRLYQRAGYRLIKTKSLGVPGTDLCFFEKNLADDAG